MKKTFLISVAAILAIIATLLFLRLKLGIGGDALDVDALLPENPDFVVIENVPVLGRESGHGFAGIFGTAKERPYAVFVDSLVNEGILVSDVSSRIAVSSSSAGNSFVAIYALAADAGDIHRSMGRIIREIWGEKAGFQEMDRGVEWISAGKSSFAAAVLKGWLLFSNDRGMLSGIFKKEGPLEVKDSISVYRRYMSVETDLGVYMGKDKYMEGVDWAVFDVALSSGHYDMKGLFCIADSVWYRSIVDQEARNSGFDACFVSGFNKVYWLNLGNVKSFMQSPWSGFGKNMKDPGNLDRLVAGAGAFLTGNLAMADAFGGKVALFEISSGAEVLDLIEKTIPSTGNFRVSGNYCWKGSGKYLASLFGNSAENCSMNTVSVLGNLMVVASSEEVMRKYIEDYTGKDLLIKQDWYKAYSDRQASKFSFSVFGRNTGRNNLPQEISAVSGKDCLGMDDVWGYQLEGTTGNMYISSVILDGGKKHTATGTVSQDRQTGQLQPRKTDVASVSKGPASAISSALGVKLLFEPVKVKNHINGSQEWFVQDERANIYLLDSKYRTLWKAPVDGRIISDIHQVDRYRNGKLQYLFSTSKTIYLVDRNGMLVSGFPIKLPSESRIGLSLFHYDHQKDYRIFIPCSNRKVYLYGIDGNRIKGWNIPQCGAAIVSKVEHIRIKSKDYILAADKNHLNIWDRRGNVRVRCSRKFNFDAEVLISSATVNAKSVFVLQSAGKKYYIDLNGNELIIK